MELHDPKRPRLTPGGTQYLLSYGTIVPSINLTFPEPGKVKMMVFLVTRGVNVARDFNKVIPIDILTGVIQDFESNPEHFLENWFNYTGPTPALLDKQYLVKEYPQAQK